MKIWLDLTNSPHVNFFAGMIRELEKEHDLLITCRPLSNTVELLDLCGFPYHVVGRHYGQSSVKKALGFGIRILQLTSFLKGRGIDVAISHSSFYSPVVARILGIRSIYLNDNEHADGNRISFRCADTVMVPEFLDPGKVQRQGADPRKIVTYPGVKEGVYLWEYQPAQGSPHLPARDGRPMIFIRPEPSTAQYYRGKVNFIDDVIVALKERYAVVVLPRGAEQERHYRRGEFQGVFVPSCSVTLQQIMGNCDLFIGAGGTMTREAAVLGIPTISIYQDEPLDVDGFLIGCGCMVHRAHLDPVFIESFLSNTARRQPNRHLLSKGKQAYQLIKSTLLEVGKKEV